MATRCNITIEHGTRKLWIYRHYDGYLSVTGADILRAFAPPKHSWANNFRYDSVESMANVLLSRCYPADEYSEARPIYELTSGAHGDIEFLYCVRWTEDQGLTIVYQHNTKQWLPLDTHAINREIKAMNDRQKHLIETKAIPGPYEPAELVPVPS